MYGVRTTWKILCGDQRGVGFDGLTGCACTHRASVLQVCYPLWHV